MVEPKTDEDVCMVMTVTLSVHSFMYCFAHITYQCMRVFKIIYVCVCQYIIAVSTLLIIVCACVFYIALLLLCKALSLSLCMCCVSLVCLCLLVIGCVSRDLLAVGTWHLFGISPWYVDKTLRSRVTVYVYASICIPYIQMY